MIRKFDKSLAAPLYKRKFAEMIADCYYEDALDYLIKYRDETGMPDFHLACGMVYLLISQTSDDREFYSLALKEFLLHIRDYPDCRNAYRDLLATVLLRREPRAMLECGDWIRSRGFDMDEMLGELASVDIDILLETPDGVFLDDLFAADGYGSIWTDNDSVEHDNTDDVGTAPQSRVIKFKGAKTDSAKTPAAPAQATTKEDDFDAQATMEFIKSLAQGFDDGDAFLDIIDGDGGNGKGMGRGNKPDSVKSRLLLRDAERNCEGGRYEKALEKLALIPKTDLHLYYCAQCLRGYIYLEIGEVDKAREAVDIALGIEPAGALAGTLLCAIYEQQGKTDRIGQVLLNTDIADYIDADHACKAFAMAVKYCRSDEALDIAEEFIDEYNVLSMRLIYAQMLYNNGEREDALKELYLLTRLQPNDFNVKYYYMLARSEPKELPIGVDAPYKVLGTVVDNFITFMLNGTPNDEVIGSEAFEAGLSVFLTLEYDYDKLVMVEMFGTLEKLAGDVRLEGKMRDALISPYVEPIIKAMVLSKLFERDKKFVMEVAFCPMSDDTLPKLCDGCSKGFYTAYAFVAALWKPAFKLFTQKAEELKPVLDGTDFSERDKALYLLRTLKKSSKYIRIKFDNRIYYALGFSSKTEGERAYKNLSAAVSRAQGESNHD